MIITTTDQAARLLNVSRSVTKIAVAKKRVKVTRKTIPRRRPTKRNGRKKKRRKKKP